MGCDIHGYLEYKTPDPDCDYTWRSFGGRINTGRQYGIFAKLAGVRNYYEIVPIVSPRGLPDKLGYEAEGDSRLYISGETGEGHCTPENAARWVKDGGCQYVDDKDGKHIWVTHPDWHSHSWVTAAELEQVLQDPKVQASKENDSSYFALLAAMKELEHCGKIVRFVFWFDN